MLIVREEEGRACPVRARHERRDHARAELLADLHVGGWMLVPLLIERPEPARVQKGDLRQCARRRVREILRDRHHVGCMIAYVREEDEHRHVGDVLSPGNAVGVEGKSFWMWPNERFYASFRYRAQSWSRSRRVVAKVEWHPGELYPRVGFIVTNLHRSAKRVVAFYNGRGTAETTPRRASTR
jgi:hypothetical protein